MHKAHQISSCVIKSNWFLELVKYTSPENKQKDLRFKSSKREKKDNL